MQADLHTEKDNIHTSVLHPLSRLFTLTIPSLFNKYLSLQLHTLHHPSEFTRIKYVSALAPPVYMLSLE